MATRVHSRSPDVWLSRTPSPLLTRSCSLPRLHRLDEDDDATPVPLPHQQHRRRPPSDNDDDAAAAAEQPLCPLCLEPILIDQVTLTFACRGRRANSQPHQIHVGACQHEFLASTTARAGVRCPICRDEQPEELRSMAPGGAYRLHGRVRLLMWPHPHLSD